MANAQVRGVGGPIVKHSEKIPTLFGVYFIFMNNLPKRQWNGDIIPFKSEMDFLLTYRWRIPSLSVCVTFSFLVCLLIFICLGS